MSDPAWLLTVGEVLVSLAMLVGASFTLIGSIALVKLPDLMMRLHGPAKTSTLGVGGFVVAAILDALFFQEGASLHELLIIVFIFMTTPISAYMIAKAHVFRTRGRTVQPLPPTGRPVGWATMDGSDAFRADDLMVKDRGGLPAAEAAPKGVTHDNRAASQ
ncbi:multisubunit potassium/proton antiporter, PhaG subunit [Arboricoccus pini]|uniref:Multisubunit potassium/proton antiporter, PhaG subunit n=1 Tax=Arboricoccus pini TaxID=1963835 RepID=A0A212Q2P7_9PROT|nr:Na+/H+ antiporter subunit G [Arboricoccus pini]SNB53637.1 multisubunit potassium/proton antiporter, PhaG subunit [Arboricoccus pini]